MNDLISKYAHFLFALFVKPLPVKIKKHQPSLK